MDVSLQNKVDFLINKVYNYEQKNKKPAISVVKDIKRQTRRKFSAEEKIRIIIEGMRGEDSIAEICRKEGIYPSLYYKWSKDFMEAGKRRLLGDTVREANTSEVKELKDENNDLKQVVAELLLKNRVLKKSLSGAEFDGDHI